LSHRFLSTVSIVAHNVASVAMEIRFLCKRVKSRRKRWTRRQRNGSRRVERPRSVECIRACACGTRAFVCVREGRTKGGGYKRERERGARNGREKGCARVLGGDRTWASLFAAWLRVEEEGLKAGKAGRTRRKQEKATGGERRSCASLPEGRRHAEVRNSCVRLRAVTMKR